MSKISYVNGQYLPNFQANISINDRSLHFADAVYEVVPVYNKQLIFWEEHFKRLQSSLKYLDINFLHSKKILSFKCLEVLERNSLSEGILYIHISRGIATRNHDWNAFIKPTLIISAINKKVFKFKEKPISLITHADIRWKRAYIKSTSLLPNILLKKKAVENKAYECILKDSKGNITEATHSNIFLVKSNSLITTPLDKNILPGVTRKKILEYARKLKIKTLIKSFSEKEIFKADSTFVTNSSSFINEACRLNNKKLKQTGIETITKIKNKFRYEIENNEYHK